jgi:prepilin-type N-terminal cleavage/methylation domain-containing protein
MRPATAMLPDSGPARQAPIAPRRCACGWAPSKSRQTSTARPRSRRAFTLIELILVMAILTVAVSMTAPTLSRFFRGQTLDSEARQLLALTRHGQSRAISEGLPMDLWIDAEQGKLGLEAEHSYEMDDPKETHLDLDAGVHLELPMRVQPAANTNLNPNQVVSVASVRRVLLVHANLPTIRFLPDGSIGDLSPQALRLVDRDGGFLWVKQTRDRLGYEIRNSEN